MRTAIALSLMLLMAAFAQAQTPTPFDCQFSANFTATSTTTASYPNPGPAAPCVSWRLTYSTQNATGVSISLQGTTNLPTGQPDPAGWTNLSVTAPVTNPATGTAAGTIAACCDYYPWIRAVAGTFTGTGQTMSLAVFGYKGTSASRNTGGGGGSGTVTGGPFTAGDVVIGAGGQAIADSGSPPFANPMTALGDMIAGGSSPAGAPTRLPGNTTNVPLVLTETGNGSGVVSLTWAPIPSQGYYSYYFTSTSSSPTSTYYQAQVPPQATEHTFNFIGVASNAVLINFATNAGVPNLGEIAIGSFTCHVRGYKNGGSTTTLYCEIWEVSSTEVDIAKIGTTEISPPLTSFETGYDLHYVLPSIYTLSSTSSRIVARVWENSVAAPTISLTVGTPSDAHIELPSATVDITSFVPYTGATQNTDLGLFGIIGAPFTGDSGSGGTTGLVTAPAAGDAAAGKFLKADATWAVPRAYSLPTATNVILGGVTMSTSTSSVAVATDDPRITASAYPTVIDGSPIAWSLGSRTVTNGIVTLNHATSTRALNLTNLVNGGFYTLVIKQDGTGGAQMTLGSGCTWKVVNGGAGAITLSAAANAIDILTFTYDSANCYAILNSNFN